jgi:hypothetical protein
MIVAGVVGAVRSAVAELRLPVEQVERLERSIAGQLRLVRAREG